VSPAKREVIAPHELRLGPPLRRLLHEGIFSVSFDEDFAAVYSLRVMQARLQTPHLVAALVAAFIALHQDGHAHTR
jgi:leucyl/phenylalanyl-tRNA--protein transferase